MEQQSQTKTDNQPISPRKKLKQKLTSDISLHLQDLYVKNPHVIPPADVIHQIQDIYKLVHESPQSRNIKTIRKIKSELSEFNCFKQAPLNQENPQFLQVFKRDNNNIISMISQFVQITQYAKGSIIQVTAAKRKSLKMLLFGQVFAFEPINHKSYKNCLKRQKDNQINIHIAQNSQNMLEQLLTKITQISQDQDINQIEINQQLNSHQQNPQFQLANSYLKQDTLMNSLENTEQFPQIGECLTVAQCRHLLMKCGLISANTPHRQLRHFNITDLITDKEQPLFIDQKAEYNCSVVSGTYCVLLQICYSVAKEVIQLINSDRERPFIQSMLFKFPILKYFEAKKYVTQQFMITHQIEQQNGTKQGTKAIQTIKQLKVVNSINLQLRYTGDIYLIISGSVTLVMNQISERKPSSLDEYVHSQKSITNKEILQIFKHDVFGFQKIGQNKHVNLRYLVAAGSKLLKINDHVLKTHMQHLPNFKHEVQKLIQVRNELIQGFLSKAQEIQRHSILTYAQNIQGRRGGGYKSVQLHKNDAMISQLKYLGHQNFGKASSQIRKHFSPERQDQKKKSLSPEIVKQSGLGVEFSQSILKKLKQKIEIKNGWILIRNSKGELLRKKQVNQKGKNSEYLQQGENDILLRRLGILSTKQIADHNFEIVKKRPSNYQFKDLQQEVNEFKSIRQKSESLPRLKQFYAKKQDRLFTILYKKTHF